LLTNFASSNSNDNIISSISVADPPEQLKEIFEEVKQLREIIATIDKDVTLIEESYNNTLASVSASRISLANENIANYTREINKLSIDVKARLKKIEEDNTNNHCHTPEAEQRMREAFHANLAKSFFFAISKYQDVSNISTLKYREKVERQVTIISGQKPTEEQLDVILQHGDAQKIFETELLQGKHQDEAANALIFLKERQQDLNKLEANISEIHHVFLDMASLVEIQGNLVDQIEFNVKKANAFAEEAVVQLAKAGDLTTHARSKFIILAILIVVIISVMGGAIGIWFLI